MSEDKPKVRPSINIDIEGYHTLMAEEVFPDGVPDTYTAEDVMLLLAASPGFMHNLRDWGLLNDLTIRVHVVGSPSAEAQT
jgi:hypothetical protein